MRKEDPALQSCGGTFANMRQQVVIVFRNSACDLITLHVHYSIKIVEDQRPKALAVEYAKVLKIFDDLSVVFGPRVFVLWWQYFVKYSLDHSNIEWVCRIRFSRQREGVLIAFSQDSTKFEIHGFKQSGYAMDRPANRNGNALFVLVLQFMRRGSPNMLGQSSSLYLNNLANQSGEARYTLP